MKTTAAVAAIILSVLTGGQVLAQVKDAALWASVTLEKRITPRFAVSVSEEVRFVENISELGTIFTELGTGYNFGKKEGIRLYANYRFSQKRDDSYLYSSRHRYNIDLSLRRKFGILVPIYRTRFQSQFKDVYTSPTGIVPDYYSRHKLIMRIDTERRYKPFVSAEVFIPIPLQNGFSNAFEDLYYDNLRFAAGVDFEFNERSALGIAYMYDREVNVKNPYTSYITSIGYTFSF